MFRRPVFLVLFCAIAVYAGATAVVWATEKKSPDSSSDQIAKLREKVAQLEARVAALEQKQPLIALPGANPPVHVPLETLPKGWEQREFNGSPYYIVPLGGGKGGDSLLPSPHGKLNR